ncbi:MAG: hypothetical protein KDC38_13675 [Planctomycetes bacterium]|nr:hypothetical protein [Planctomycetota bacterium]
MGMSRSASGLAGLGLLMLWTVRSDGQVVEFFGVPIEESDIVFCVDRSNSMDWFGDWVAVEAELVDTLGQLGPTQRFSIVVFGAGVIEFSPDVVGATPLAVADAIDFVLQFVPAGQTCLVPGLTAALAIAASATPGDRVVVLVGNGGDNCTSANPLSPAVTIAQLTAANPDDVPIDALYAAESTIEGLPIYQEISLEFGGIFALTEGPQFMRGDANINGSVEIGDAITILESLGAYPSGAFLCPAARDVDANGVVEPLLDGVALLDSLFGGAPIPWPTPPQCGQNLTAPPLYCVGYTGCP